MRCGWRAAGDGGRHRRHKNAMRTAGSTTAGAHREAPWPKQGHRNTRTRTPVDQNERRLTKKKVPVDEEEGSCRREQWAPGTPPTRGRRLTKARGRAATPPPDCNMRPRYPDLAPGKAGAPCDRPEWRPGLPNTDPRGGWVANKPTLAVKAGRPSCSPKRGQLAPRKCREYYYWACVEGSIWLAPNCSLGPSNTSSS